MKSITAYHHHEVQGHADGHAHTIFRHHGAEHIGTGMVLHTGERDIHYHIDDHKADACALDLLKGGFKVTMRDAATALPEPGKAPEFADP